VGPRAAPHGFLERKISLLPVFEARTVQSEARRHTYYTVTGLL